jgi:hypothetical protein
VLGPLGGAAVMPWGNPRRARRCPSCSPRRRTAVVAGMRPLGLVLNAMGVHPGPPGTPKGHALVHAFLACMRAALAGTRQGGSACAPWAV